MLASLKPPGLEQSAIRSNAPVALRDCPDAPKDAHGDPIKASDTIKSAHIHYTAVHVPQGSVQEQTEGAQVLQDTPDRNKRKQIVLDVFQ